MYGIKETKEVLELVKALLNAYQAAYSDGVIDWNDIIIIAGLFGPAEAAISGIELVPKEILDLDEAEANELLNEYGNTINHPAFPKMWEGVLRLLEGVAIIKNQGHTSGTPATSTV